MAFILITFFPIDFPRRGANEELDAVATGHYAVPSQQERKMRHETASPGGGLRTFLTGPPVVLQSKTKDQSNAQRGVSSLFPHPPKYCPELCCPPVRALALGTHDKVSVRARKWFDHVGPTAEPHADVCIFTTWQCSAIRRTLRRVYTAVETGQNVCWLGIQLGCISWTSKYPRYGRVDQCVQLAFDTASHESPF
jgi:hypothetical protein